MKRRVLWTPERRQNVVCGGVKRRVVGALLSIGYEKKSTTYSKPCEDVKRRILWTSTVGTFQKKIIILGSVHYSFKGWGGGVGGYK